MIVLIQNEIYKMLLKKKMILIVVLLIAFIGLFVYGEQYVYNSALERFETMTESGSFDWRILAEQQITRLNERLDSTYIPESGLRSIEIQIEQLTYFIDNNINPITPSAARFTVVFAEQSLVLFIPLLILVLGADLVSGEFSKKTIKILLTRAVPRWKIFLSKYIALLMMTTLVLLLMGLIASLVSGVFFGYWGFNEPIATGFRLINGSLDARNVIMISRIQYMVLIYALAWVVSVVIATIILMVSVLVKTTASAIGIIMATLIGGQFLQYFLSEWPIVKYFFVSNLDLSKYMTGSYQPIEGMSLAFSIGVLLSWAAVSLLISFIVFIREDILV
ncbi:ABC transporter permease [Gottschalkiaceae bacterium SANA]|nr:ABC transporter permease [Gottschalkiaceae bacterium SANA]